MTNTTSQNRLVFLDNLRYFIVLLVVILHVSISYANVGAPWWYVVDANKHAFFDILIIVLDSFIMPVLFFIAGYFALNSIRQKTLDAFIVSKLKRLGIPLFFFFKQKTAYEMLM